MRKKRTFDEDISYYGKRKMKRNVSKLLSLFCAESGKVVYDFDTQAKATELMNLILSASGTFKRTIKKEKEAIKEDLVIISDDGEEISLVDPDSIDERVRSVLNVNNIYTCLKSLALANKCAHVFSGKIEEVQADILEFCDGKISEQDLSFFKSVDKVFPNIPRDFKPKYKLRMSSGQFLVDNIKLLKSGNKSIKMKQKIAILKSFGVKFDPTDPKVVDDCYSALVDDSQEIINTYIWLKYKEGRQWLKMQNKMFAVKDAYIAMVGQLLSKGNLGDIMYELVKTEEGEKGFKYLLIIDDKELSYYVEVHMPNALGYQLAHEYGLKLKTARNTRSLGASSIYRRSRPEMKKIKKALEEGKITGNPARAKIITRGMVDELPIIDKDIDDPEDQKNDPYDSTDDSHYSFVTDPMRMFYTEFEEFLESNKLCEKELEENREMKLNETHSIEVTEKIACENYCDIFESFSLKQKRDFLEFSSRKLDESDDFDKAFLRELIIYERELGIDKIGKLIINKNGIKRDFIRKHREVIRSKDYEKISDLAYEFIDEYLKADKELGLGREEHCGTFGAESNPNVFEEYLKINCLSKEELEELDKVIFNDDDRLNEIFPIYDVQKNMRDKYINIYNTLDEYQKREFVNYAFDKRNDFDDFDRALLDELIINENNLSINEIGMIIINKDIMKRDFEEKNKGLLDLNDREKISYLTYEYINDYVRTNDDLKKQLNKENDINGPKHRR